MASWLVIGGAVGAGLMAVSLLVLGCVLFAERQYGWAWAALAGMGLVVFLAILGDMYATGWWDK